MSAVRPEDETFDKAGWVSVAVVVCVLAYVGLGLWRDDWYLAGIVAGGLYGGIVLTIIALKD